MNTALMSERIAGVSPRLKARAAGVFYLLTMVMGGVALSVHGRLGVAVDLVATACYIAVTALFYDLFKPVNRSLSLLAASSTWRDWPWGNLTCILKAWISKWYLSDSIAS